MNVVLYIFGWLVALAIIYWLMWRKNFDGLRSSWYCERDLKGRVPLNAEEFHRLYYANSGIPSELVEHFRKFMGKCWGVDSTRLIPEDDLVQTYHCDVVDFVGDIEDEFGIRVPREDLTSMDTSFDGLLRCVHAASAA